jgi:hypothetical protein
MDLLSWEGMAPILAVFSPILVLLLSGLWLNGSLEKLKSRLQKSQALVQKRAEIYSEIQEPLNDIYCYIKRMGKWKKQTPEEVLECKRIIDQKMYSTRPFWSKDMQFAYEDFMNTCFVTNRGHTVNAGIVAEVVKYKELDTWKEDFLGYYDGDFDESKLEKVNDKLMSAFSKDFGIE